LGVATNTDPNLINSWGIVIVNNQIWVADNGTGKITTYGLTGNILSPVVTVPPAIGITGSPDGIVYNGTAGYVFTSGSNTGPAMFLVSTEDGTVAAYSPTVNPTNAITVINNNASGTVYKGLAITSSNLYIADFFGAKIDTYSNTFVLQSPVNFPFSDPSIPAGFAPFNIVFISGLLYVLYAKQDGAKHDDVAGPGNGFINIFNTNGVLLKRFASQGPLNSPWGMIPAPCSCEFPQGSFLVGNFGDGFINVFSSFGAWLGRVKDINGFDINIPGLWGLASNPAFSTPNIVYFASGPNAEANGLVGSLTKCPNPCPCPCPNPCSNPCFNPCNPC